MRERSVILIARGVVVVSQLLNLEEGSLVSFKFINRSFFHELADFLSRMGELYIRNAL